MDEVKERSISISDIAKVLVNRIWIIAVVSIVCAVATFCYSSFVKKQQYVSSSMIYANSAVNDLMGTISSAIVATNKSLVNTYSVIWKCCREAIFRLCESPQRDIYSFDSLKKMIKVETVSNTEIFKISVVCEDKEDAENLCNSIVDSFEDEVRRITNADIVVVEYPVLATAVSKQRAKYTVIGFVVGLVLSVGFVIIVDLFIDDTIDSVEIVKSNYCDELPLLAIVPDENVSSKKHNHYYYYRRNYTSNNDSEEK